MAIVTDRGRVTTVGRGRPGAARPSPLPTTLYDLITAIQDVVSADGFMTELGGLGFYRALHPKLNFFGFKPDPTKRTPTGDKLSWGCNDQ